MDFDENLERLRAAYADAAGNAVRRPSFRRIAEKVFDQSGTRHATYAGIPTFLDVPFRQIDWRHPDFSGLDVAMLGVPMDIGASNRPGARFGPRALRTIERVGPYDHVLDTAPAAEIKVADIGDVPFRSRFHLEQSHDDIERAIAALAAAGVAPLSVGGDHSMTRPILRALGRDRPLGMIQIDAHCDTMGAFDGSRFHHGGPFRLAVLDGVLDPARTVQIGIRGASEYLWEFSYDAGMMVFHVEDIDRLGVAAIVETARRIVGDGPTYLSFDIDSLDPAFAPGTGTPEVGGLSTREALAILRGLKGVNFVGGDVVEVAPQYDATTATALAGAQVLFEILCLLRFSPSVGARGG